MKLTPEVLEAARKVIFAEAGRKGGSVCSARKRRAARKNVRKRWEMAEARNQCQNNPTRGQA